MRCGCKECGTYMIQADSDKLGCVCPECGARCRDCLGTDTVVSREALRSLAFDPRFQPDQLAANFLPREEEGDIDVLNWRDQVRAVRERWGG